MVEDDKVESEGMEVDKSDTEDDIETKDKDGHEEGRKSVEEIGEDTVSVVVESVCLKEGQEVVRSEVTEGNTRMKRSREIKENSCVLDKPQVNLQHKLKLQVLFRPSGAGCV